MMRNSLYWKISIATLLITLPTGSYGDEKTDASKKNGFFSRVVESAANYLNPQITFTSSPPEDFYYNPHKGFSTLEHGSEVTLLEPSRLVGNLELVNGSMTQATPNSPFPMDIYLNDGLDEGLADLSKDNHGREAGHVIALDERGRRLAVSLATVEYSNGIRASSIYQLLDQVLGQPGTRLIEFVHTHPQYEFIVKNQALDEKNVPYDNYGFNGLSREDLWEAEKLSHNLPNTFVRIRAVLPNGYNYSATYMNGSRVQDPLYAISDAGKRTKLLHFKKNYPSVQITPEVQAKIENAKSHSEFQQLAKAGDRIGKILTQAGISALDPDHHQHEIAAKSLLAQGYSDEAVVDSIIKSREFVRLDKLEFQVEEILAKVGIAFSHPNRDAHAISAKSLLAQGHSEESVANCIIHTLEQMRIFEEMDKSLPSSDY